MRCTKELNKELTLIGDEPIGAIGLQETGSENKKWWAVVAHPSKLRLYAGSSTGSGADALKVWFDPESNPWTPQPRPKPEVWLPGPIPPPGELGGPAQMGSDEDDE